MARMVPVPAPDSPRPLVVELTEWQQVGPATDPRLRGYSLGADAALRSLAQSLRGRVDIREGREGLEIASTSFVGCVDVGALRIAIRPKLPAMPLARLLRYAYGLRDVRTTEVTRAPTTRYGLHDLLIALLAVEVEELLHRGLARRYIPLSENLESPRGRIMMEKFIRQGGLREAQLPCQHFERRVDWHLNQVLRAGLDTAARMTEDRDLRRRVQQLSAMFGGVKRLVNFEASDIDQAERNLTRLTAASGPALTIIRLLKDMLGVAFNPADQSSRMPGFLFDMNRFFQRLLSRFLRDHLTGQRVVDEWPIRDLFAYAKDANPRGRRAPRPRPDYALLLNNSLLGFLDAKYRDIWLYDFPPEWLYQLSIYALASPVRVSVLLYASMAGEARAERVDIQQPGPWSKGGPASVIFRPVQLPRLADLLDPDQVNRHAADRDRRQFAEDLVMLQTSKSNDIGQRMERFARIEPQS